MFSHSLVNSVSRSFVHEDPLVKSDAIVVLVGSNSGNRIRTAVKLYNEGFADKLVFSGFEIYPGISSGTLMKSYAMSLGVPEDKILYFPAGKEVEASTRGESMANLEFLKKNKMFQFIVVTSSFHTRRARLIYERSISQLDDDFKLMVFPAPDPFVPMEGWWKLRTGQKAIFYESLKLLAYYFGGS